MDAQKKTKKVRGMEAQEAVADLFYRHGKRLQITRGTELYRSSVDAEWKCAFFLDRGFCSLSGLTRGGKEHVFLYCQGKRLIGFLPLMHISRDTKDPLPVIITAKTACVVYQVTAAQFEDFLEEPDFNKYLALTLAENYLGLLKHYQSMQDQCATSRLCRLLLDYAIKEGERMMMPAYFNMTELSRYLGVHTVTVSRIMAQLRQRKYIDKIGHRIVVLDREQLKRSIEEQRNFDY